MTKIIAVANQKGGVGKTTTAINLSSELARKGLKILLIDLDPQANTSSGLGLEKSPTKNIYHVLINNAEFADIVVATKIQNLYIAASCVDLSGASVELPYLDDFQLVLKNKLYKLEGQYDYIFIDCPPTLGVLTVNALVAAKSVLIPLQCEYFALEGMSQLLDTIKSIRDSYNKDLHVEGILATMYDSRNNISKQVLAELQQHFPKFLFNAVISRNVKLSEAPSHGLPICLYDEASKGSKQYSQLASELMS